MIKEKVKQQKEKKEEMIFNYNRAEKFVDKILENTENRDKNIYDLMRFCNAAKKYKSFNDVCMGIIGGSAVATSAISSFYAANEHFIFIPIGVSSLLFFTSVFNLVNLDNKRTTGYDVRNIINQNNFEDEFVFESKVATSSYFTKLKLKDFSRLADHVKATYPVEFEEYLNTKKAEKLIHDTRKKHKDVDDFFNTNGKNFDLVTDVKKFMTKRKDLKIQKRKEEISQLETQKRLEEYVQQSNRELDEKYGLKL